MLGLGLNIAKMGNKVSIAIQKIRQYWNKNQQQWQNVNKNWESL